MATTTPDVNTPIDYVQPIKIVGPERPYAYGHKSTNKLLAQLGPHYAERSPIILNLEQVKAKTSLSKSTIYRIMRHWGFPKQIYLSAGRVGWIEQEVDAWIQDCINWS